MNGIVAEVRIVKSAEYDNWEQGAGVKADGTWDNSRWETDIDSTILHAKERGEFQNVLRKHLRNYGLELDTFLIFDDGRLTGDRMEDDNGDELTVDKCRQYHKAGRQLYIADYDVLIELLPEERDPTKAELAELLPDLNDYDK